MNTRWYALMCGASLVAGILVYAYTQEWIIIQWPHATRTLGSDGQSGIKKKVELSFWHQGAWRSETQELVIPQSTPEALYVVVSNWLALLDEEGVTDKKVALQTALLTHNGAYAYLSFDRSPLPTECSTFQQWMWVEGLLKTIRDAGIHVQSVYFLVNHQSLQDDRLDFTNPWPVKGYLSS